MKINELFEKRMLRKIEPDLEKSEKSKEISNKFLKDSKKLLKLNHLQMSLLATYNSSFHPLRALLYKDGIQEKSHFAISVYVKEKYLNEFKDLTVDIDTIRNQRHEGLYGLDYDIDSKDCEYAIKVAKKIKVIVNRIIKGDYNGCK